MSTDTCMKIVVKIIMEMFSNVQHTLKTQCQSHRNFKHTPREIQQYLKSNNVQTFSYTSTTMSEIKQRPNCLQYQKNPTVAV